MKKLLFSLMGTALLFIGCTDFPTSFENVVQNEKLRPFAIVCDPPEAAPGDTVTVRLYYYAPHNDPPATHWKISLDYGTDLMGNEYEKRVVDLDAMMLPGSTPDSFRFRVPDSALLYSTQLSTMMPQLAEMAPDLGVSASDLTVHAVDSVIRLAIGLGATPPPELQLVIDNFSSRLKLHAEMRASIFVDVTMLLRVRYSGKFHSPDVNTNPVMNWMGIIKMPGNNFNDLDSLSNYHYEFQYLFNRLDPGTVRDTVVVDSGYTYIAIADTGVQGVQTYEYYSLQSRTIEKDTVGYRYSWFFTNIDYTSSMVMDSLIMFGHGERHAMQIILPPVDVRMHRFQLYAVERNQRQNDLMFTPGEAYMTATGYFSYTPAYARSLIRSGGGHGF